MQLYYIIIGSAVSLPANRLPIMSLTQGYFDNDNKSWFIDNDKFFIYSGDDKLEQITGSQLNIAIRCIGRDRFANLSNYGVHEIDDLTINTDNLALVLRNRRIILAYMGIIWEVSDVRLLFTEIKSNFLLLHVLILGQRFILSFHEDSEMQAIMGKIKKVRGV